MATLSPVNPTSNPTNQNSSYNFTPGASLDETISRAVNSLREANRPIIDSYNSSIGETQQRFANQKTQLEGRRQPLQDRYSNLISSIKNQGQQDVTNQTRITNNELGKRGLLSSSTLAQQEIQNATSPLMQKYAGLEKDASLAQEDEMRNLENQISGLAGQETDSLRAIQNAIAQLQANTQQQGISLGTDAFNRYQEQERQRVAMEEARRQQELDNQYRQAQAEAARRQAEQENSFRERQFQEQLRQQQIQNQQNAPTDISKYLSNSVLGQSTQQSQPQGQYISSIGKSVVGRAPDGRYIYSDGTMGWGGFNSSSPSISSNSSEGSFAQQLLAQANRQFRS